MADELTFLIQTPEDTDTYDRENALIDLYIFLKSQNFFYHPQTTHFYLWNCHSGVTVLLGMVLSPIMKEKIR